MYVYVYLWLTDNESYNIWRIRNNICIQCAENSPDNGHTGTDKIHTKFFDQIVQSHSFQIEDIAIQTGMNFLDSRMATTFSSRRISVSCSTLDIKEIVILGTECLCIFIGRIFCRVSDFFFFLTNIERIKLKLSNKITYYQNYSR